MITNMLPLFAGLVAAAAPAYLIRFSVFGIPTTALEILIYTFVAAVVLSRWGNLQFPPRNVLWPIILFILAAVISTIIAPDQRTALGILKAWIFDPILFAWALYQLRERREVLVATITGLVAGALAVASIAVVQRLIGAVTIDGRVIGPYAWFPAENASPNYLALYLAPLGVLTAGIGIGSLAVGRRRGLLSLLGAALIALAIYLSFSRAGLVALGVGVATMLVLRHWSLLRSRLVLRLSLSAFVVLAAIGAWFFIRPDPLLSPEEGGRITASNNVRWEIWKTTVTEIIPAHPIFGVGLGNYQDYFTELTRGRVNYDRIAPLALTPHNLFLSLWTNLGLAGLIALLWLLVILVRRTWSTLVNLQKNPGREGKLAIWILISLVGSLVALLAHGFLDTPYFKNDLSLLFWTTIAILVFLMDAQPVWKETKHP